MMLGKTKLTNSDGCPFIQINSLVQKMLRHCINEPPSDFMLTRVYPASSVNFVLSSKAGTQQFGIQFLYISVNLLP